MDFDAIRFLSDHNFEYWTSGPNTQEGWANIQCPFCGDDTNHGGFNLVKNYYNCWKCGAHSIENVIMELLSIKYYEAKKLVQEYFGRSQILMKLNKKKSNIEKIELPGNKLDKIHKRYLRKRDFDPDELEEKYELKGTGISGYWKFRLMIPILFKKRLVSYQGRDVTDQQKLRYKSLSPDESIINPKHILYNYDNCKKDSIGVVEGAFDVFRMSDDFVATFGTSVTEYQIKLLSGFKNIFFFFDPEEEAQERGAGVAVKLSSLGCNVELIELDHGYDPADLDEKEAINVRKEIGI